MQRYTYIDSAKTILIFLVVLGHCFVRLGEGKYVNTCISVIYTFHMPLFVFFSGLLFNTDGSWKKVLRGSLEFLVTYCLFQFFLMQLNNVPLTIRSIILPQFALWYLLSLAFWRILLKLFSAVSNDRKVWLVWAIVSTIVVGFIPVDRELSLQRTLTFFPFFVIGNAFRNAVVLGRVKRVDYRIPLLLLIVFFLIALFYVERPPFWLLCGRTAFYGYHSSLFLAPFIKLGWYLLVLTVSMCVLCLIPDKKCLSVCGNKTLTIYLFHYYPILILEKLAFRTDNLFLLLCLASVIFVITVFMHELKLIRFLVNPLKIGRILLESSETSKRT